MSQDVNTINKKKQDKYNRIKTQISELLTKCELPEARMASILAILHHKMKGFFWTGFYTLHNDRLIVKMYQGPVACMELKKNTGVCWSAVNQQKAIVVTDVHAFPGHIACDGRSKSEVVVPLFDDKQNLIGVLDIDSDSLNTFDSIDADNLKDILAMIYTIPYKKPENLL